MSIGIELIFAAHVLGTFSTESARNGLGILRQCLETQKLEELGDRLNKLEGFDPVATRAIKRQMVTLAPLPPLIEANGHEPGDDHKAH